MKAFNKLLLATTMITALGMSVSCNNQKSTPSAGLPYTFVEAGYVEDEKPVEIKFKYKGKNMKSYWSDDPEKATTETSHTFKADFDEAIYFIVEGNITSFNLCDENGNALAEGNKRAEIIIFGNTIKSIPTYGFYNCRAVELTYIPASVKKVGKNAFFYSNFMCESPSRPSGWDPNWCVYSSMSTMTLWGVGAYITDDGFVYILATDKKIRSAVYFGQMLPLGKGKNDIVVPEKLDVYGVKYTITEIMQLGMESDYVKTITLPKSIQHIASIEYADNLTAINFPDECDFLSLESRAFQECEQLETIKFPKGLINIPDKVFDGCTKLKEVVIPSTVKKVGSSVFMYVGTSGDDTLTVDLTGYKNADSIAICEEGEMVDYCNASVTFKYDGSTGLKEEDFVVKGWPAEGSGGGVTPAVTWTPATTSLS